MKRITVASLILLGLLAATIGNGLYLTHSAGQVTALLEESKTAAEQEDWEKALTLSNEAEEKWMSADFYHHVVLHVESLEEISVGFQELQQFLKTQDDAETAAAAGRLIRRIQMTAEKEQLRLENIF